MITPIFFQDGLLLALVVNPWRWLVVYVCAGLLGTVTAAVLTPKRLYGIHMRSRLRAVALALPALAIAGTLLHDNHGLPLLLGMALGSTLLPRSAAV